MTIREFLTGLSNDELMEILKRLGRDVRELLLDDLEGYATLVCCELELMGYDIEEVEL